MAQQKPPEDKQLPPSFLPTNAWEAVSKMPNLLNAEAAGDLSTIIGFIASGSETCEPSLQMKNGICKLNEQLDREPDFPMETFSSVELTISRGLDPQRTG